MTTKASPTYVAVVGIDTEKGDRYEPGDEVPARVVKKSKWLLKAGKVKES